MRVRVCERACVCVRLSHPPVSLLIRRSARPTRLAWSVVTSRGASLRSILRSAATPFATLRDPFLVLGGGIFASHRKLSREINVNFGQCLASGFPRFSAVVIVRGWLGERLANFPKSPS